MKCSSLALLSVITFILFFVTGCTKGLVTESELSKYVSDEDNGLTKSIQVGPTEISVSAQPNDLLVARELRGIASPSSLELLKAKAKYEGQYYFILRLSREGKEVVTPAEAGLASFSELLQTLSFEMGDKVNVITSSRDTLHVADYVYNRTFGSATSSDLLFAFKKASTLERVGHLELNLEEFGLGTGSQVFRFEIDDLNDAPQIFPISQTPSI